MAFLREQGHLLTIQTVDVAGLSADRQVGSMRFGEVLYDWGVSAGRTLLPHTPLLPDKARRSVTGRNGLVERIERWAGESRGEGPLVWFHAPSVGEGLQAGPVIAALREIRPDIRIFYSYFSSSAEKLAGRLPADYADYMPFDVVSDLTRVMEALRPEVIAFSKLDVWPNVTRVARWRGVRLALVSGTLARDSSRRRWPARRLLGPAYARLDSVGAISVADATRLAQLGVRADRIEITGDARFDQVWSRARAIDHTRAPVSLLAGYGGLTLVAGSTWPEGEDRLVPAIAQVRSRHPDFRAILVPHEPTSSHVIGLQDELDRHDLWQVRLSELEGETGEPREVVIVDRVGVLGELYGVADLSYVGGGFGRRGLHSVLEPAALGVPVLFGPRHANAREAEELIERGGAVSVRSGAELESALSAWVDDRGRRIAAGEAALRYVEANLGAGRRNAELIARLLDT